jgi:hypothetical protein
MAKTAITPVKQPPSKFSNLDTSKLTPFTVDEGLDNETGQHTYHTEYKDAKGNVVKKSTSVENTSGENNDPNANVYTTTYQAPITIGNQTFTGTYGEDGTFQYGQGKEFYQNGHHWLPIIDGQGNVTYQNADPSGGFGDFVKMIAPLALGAAFPGLGTAIGESLLGAGAVGSATLGGAIVGGGTAALTGGDIGRGLIMGGLLPNLSTPIAGSGFTIGDVMKAGNVVKAAENGDWMSALTGAASLSGGADIKIGDYTIGELAKNAQLAKSVISGNPKAFLSTITKFANSADANKTDIIKGLQDAGLSSPDANDFINGYFAPGGEGYVAPSKDDTTSGTNLVNGYIDETTGHWIDTTTGQEIDTGRPGPLTNDNSGNLSSMKDWSFDDKTGQWTRTDPVTGEKTVYDYKTPITGTAKTGADIEKSANAGPSSSSQTQTPPKTQTPSSSAAAAAAAAATAIPSWYGLNPADVVKADKNDVAHIKSFKELFGHELFGDDKVPASSAQDQNVPEADVLKALEDTNNYASGGDIHALLQLLRS